MSEDLKRDRPAGHMCLDKVAYIDVCVFSFLYIAKGRFLPDVFQPELLNLIIPEVLKHKNGIEETSLYM